METFKKEETTINCYFLCKNKSKNTFIGFNNENIKINLSKNNICNFQDSFVYYFEKLKVDKNFLLFIENYSVYKQSNGIDLSNENINFNKFEPYSLIGKIIQIENNEIYLLTPYLNKIILISEIDELFKNVYDYQYKYIHIYHIRFNSKDENIIKFKQTNFTSFKILEDDLIKFDKINSKICFKFNLIDYDIKEDNEDNTIQIKNFGIELEDKSIKYFELDKKIIYFIYELIENKDEYFPQHIHFNDIHEHLPYELKFFVYKGFLNEVNLFIKNNYGLAYEFLYFSLDNNLPKEIEIYRKPNKKFKINNLHSFNCKTRKSVNFINVPSQNIDDLGYDTSFLYIYLCNKKEKKLYGKFCLSSIEIKKKTNYKFNQIVKILIYEIYNDFIQVNNNNLTIKKMKEKYLSFDKNVNEILVNEIKKKFYLFNYPNEKYTLEYFNALCLWNLFNYINKIHGDNNFIINYMNLYDNITKRHELNYIDKSMILINYDEQIFESKKILKSPKLFFYNDLDNNNPYKLAYYFQYDIIENLTEKSCLFLPFLFLDSYIMNCVYKKYSFTKGFLPAYSISMLPLESIKKHLKNTIKNYFFVIEKGEEDDRKYYAEVHKYNFVVTYNENILLRNSKFLNIYDFGKYSEIEEVYDLAFIINLENLHEKFSHNKEELINIKNSPTLFFDINFEYSSVYHYEAKERGEAGRFSEAFIAKETLINEMKKTQYKMGKYFKVIYYVDINFKPLIEGFKTIKDNLNQNMNENQNNININSNSLNHSPCNTNLVKISEQKENKDKKEHLKSENNDNNLEKDDDNVIYLSRHNTYIIKASTMDELMSKIEDMENKKIIKSQDAIETKDKNDNTNY